MNSDRYPGIGFGEIRSLGTAVFLFLCTFVLLASSFDESAAQRGKARSLDEFNQRVRPPGYATGPTVEETQTEVELNRLKLERTEKRVELDELVQRYIREPKGPSTRVPPWLRERSRPQRIREPRKGCKIPRRPRQRARPPVAARPPSTRAAPQPTEDAQAQPSVRPTRRPPWYTRRAEQERVRRGQRRRMYRLRNQIQGYDRNIRQLQRLQQIRNTMRRR